MVTLVMSGVTPHLTVSEQRLSRCRAQMRLGVYVGVGP